VLFTGDYLQQYFAKPRHRLPPRPSVSIADPRPLRLRQLALELMPLRGQLEQPLPPVTRARPLQDELLPHQLTKDTVQALLGDAQNAEQLGDRHLWMATDEMDDSMMRPAEPIPRENRIGIGGEVPIGLIEPTLQPVARDLDTSRRRF